MDDEKLRPSLGNTYCSLPFSQVVLQDWRAGYGASGARACVSQYGPGNNSMGLANQVSEMTVNEIFHSPQFNKLRADLLAGKKASACTTCWESERLTGSSHRLDNERVVDLLDIDNANPTLQMIDVKFGENCNLRCRMCSPGSSNKLRKDIKFFNKVGNTQMTTGNPIISFGLIGHSNLSPHAVVGWEGNSVTAQSLLSDETISTLRVIKTAGGEPFLSRYFIAFMEKMIELNVSDKVELYVTTNATKISDANIELMKKFKRVKFSLSVDSIGASYDYIRHPMKWHIIEAKILDLMKKMPAASYVVNSVASIYSIYSANDLSDWCATHGLNSSFEPVHPANGRIDPASFPQEMKDDLIKRLENGGHKSTRNLIAYLKSAVNTRSPSETKHEVVSYDQSRNQHYRDYLSPEVVSWLDSIV